MKEEIKPIPDKSNWKEIKTIEQVLQYCRKYFYKEYTPLLINLSCLDEQDYEYWVILYRLIVMAITDNEKISLIEGDLYYPYVQFCKLGREKECWENIIIGHISYESNTYSVIGNNAIYCSRTGLGGLFLETGTSNPCATLGFRVVSTLEKAKHISKYFGKVVFYIMYGGINCDWKWIN